jgi:hypothetical protein
MLEFTAPAVWRLKELAKRRRFFGLAFISGRFMSGDSARETVKV